MFTSVLNPRLSFSIQRKKAAKQVKKNPDGNNKITQNGKKKAPIQKEGDVRNGNDAPKNNNKKRKSSVINIDENMIKRWKSESMGRPSARRDASELKDAANSEERVAAPKAAAKKKKKNSVSTREPEEPIVEIKKLKKTPEIDSETGDVVTKSQKRRLKLKEKKNLAKNGDEQSKPGLKIDRLQKMLEEKQQRVSKPKKEPTSLRDRMMSRLKSSRFRYLNEQMYNSESWSSKKYFKEDPDAFTAYHEGYKLQVEQWPLNPLDTIISSVKRL